MITDGWSRLERLSNVRISSESFSLLLFGIVLVSFLCPHMHYNRRNILAVRFQDACAVIAKVIIELEHFRADDNQRPENQSMGA